MTQHLSRKKSDVTKHNDTTFIHTKPDVTKHYIHTKLDVTKHYDTKSTQNMMCLNIMTQHLSTKNLM